ncbi:MAG: ATP-binding protein, partial [Methanomassiliicoccaceae archaeon]|nr:ATP-binding protein [Methanomassiliicoccaceae archaeon]MCL2149120.1 ATP-binding protein [Methanomassiliicoccaceae archaeon]
MLATVKRESYLKRIRPFYDSDLIKVITGLRRSGKTVILDQIRDEIIRSGVPADHIVYLNFEDMDNAHLRAGAALNEFSKKYRDGTRHYFLFDEIQRVSGFEEAVNSMRATMDCSIFVTGSNSKLLSGDLATVLTGRTVSFTVMPFTFREVTECRRANGMEAKDFSEYLKWGGMPQRLQQGDDASVRTYLDSVYKDILYTDVVSRSNARDADLLTRVADFLMDNSGKVFSVSSIVDYIEGRDRRGVSTETVYNYVRHITSSMLVSGLERFDIKGKMFLSSLRKYYVADPGLVSIHRSDGSIDVGARIETVVHNELIARNYSLGTGKVGDKEVDFVAEKDGKRSYFQVCYLMGDERARDREFSALEAIDDNHPKFVISMDQIDMSRNGIEHLRLVEDFLLSDRF